MGFGQFHQVAQEGKGLLSLFQHVADQHQNIVRGEGNILHQPQKEREIAVDIADGDDPPAQRELCVMDDGAGFHDKPPF